MVAGHPGVLQEYEVPTGDFAKVIVFPGILACSGIDRSFEKHGFDLIEIGVDYSNRSEALSTFGGMSGGRRLASSSLSKRRNEDYTLR
jgi:hypothetical protein